MNDKTLTLVATEQINGYLTSLWVKINNSITAMYRSESKDASRNLAAA